MRSLGLLAAVLSTPVLARMHHLEIKNDPRFAFVIEVFGFMDGGTIDLDIRDVSVTPAGEAHTMGFVVIPVDNEDEANAYVDTLLAGKECALDRVPEGGLTIDISDPATWRDIAEPAHITGNSDFAFIFTHCSPVGAGVSVSFSLDATFSNPGGNFLSAGEMYFPALFGAFAVLFGAMAVAWAMYLRRHKQERAKIHLAMTGLLGVKTLSLVFAAVMYHYIVSRCGRAPLPLPRAHPPPRPSPGPPRRP